MLTFFLFQRVALIMLHSPGPAQNLSPYAPIFLLFVEQDYLQKNLVCKLLNIGMIFTSIIKFFSGKAILFI